MRIRHIGVVLACVLVAWQAVAQNGGKAYRIGALTESWGPTPALVGLRDGLVTLGYREHYDFVIGVRFTRGDIVALGPAARQLVAQGVDLLYVAGIPPLLAASAATSRVPILCRCNPVAVGLAESFARPAGNVTAVSDLDLDLSAKRLQLLRELVPSMMRVLFAYDTADAGAVTVLELYRASARRLGIELVAMAVDSEEAAQAILELRRENYDGLLAPVNGGRNIPGLLLEVSKREAIPSMYPGGTFWIERGALASYGPDWYESGRMAARLAHAIFQGASPSEIPIEVNPIVRLGFNVKTAERLGVEIPEAHLLSAHDLVE